jgi:hypothetical protein
VFEIDVVVRRICISPTSSLFLLMLQKVKSRKFIKLVLLTLSTVLFFFCFVFLLRV